MRESTEGSTHEGSTKKQPCLSHHGRRPRRTFLTSGRSSRSRRSPRLTNSLVQLHNLVGGSQMTPSQSRRHQSPRSNKWCVDDELLALVLQMIVSLLRPETDVPGVIQLFAVVALSFTCVLHLVMSSYALHHHAFETCIRPGLLILSIVRSEPRHTCTRLRHVRNSIL